MNGHEPLDRGTDRDTQLLSRKFTLNPGVTGVILSVPMLAITKIVYRQIRRLIALGIFWRDSGSAATAIGQYYSYTDATTADSLAASK